MQATRTKNLAPRGQRPTPSTVPYKFARVQQLYQGIEREMGGREGVVEALLAAPSSDDLNYVIGLIADPENDARDLAEICAAGKVSLGEFLEALKRGNMAKALVSAMRKVAEDTPRIIEDVLARSVVHTVTCELCDGQGSRVVKKTANDGSPYEMDEKCEPCFGRGTLTRQPEFDRQKFALTELAGLGQKKGPQVLIDQSDRSSHQQLTVLDASQDGHAKLLEATDRLLYGRRPSVPDVASAIEGEYTPAEEDEDLAVTSESVGPAKGARDGATGDAARGGLDHAERPRD